MPTSSACADGFEEDDALKGPQPWFADKTGSGTKRHAPATLRNRGVITDVLRRELPEQGTVLEIASGSGEHVMHFAQHFSRLVWQPSDPDPTARASIGAWCADAALPNILPPLDIDAASGEWTIECVDAMLCINMIHISPWQATLGLFDGALRLLGEGAPLILYGPFLQAEVETAPSNLAFDIQLRERDPRFGIRSVDDVDRAATERGFVRTALHSMPANNIMLIYRRS